MGVDVIVAAEVAVNHRSEIVEAGSGIVGISDILLDNKAVLYL